MGDSSCNATLHAGRTFTAGRPGIRGLDGNGAHSMPTEAGWADNHMDHGRMERRGGLQLNAEYWRRRAQEIRALADEMRYPQPREQTLHLAAECDSLAEKQDRLWFKSSIQREPVGAAPSMRIRRSSAA